MSDSATTWTAGLGLPVPSSWSLPQFTSIESVMLSNHLILWHSLLLLPPDVPSTGSFPMSRLFTSGGQSIGVLASAPVFLLCKKLLSIIRCYSFIFVFISVTLGDRFPKILLWFVSKSILLIFSSKNFIVSSLQFRHLIHFEFISVYGVRESLNCIIFMQLSSFPSTTSWRDSLSPHIFLPPLL